MYKQQAKSSHNGTMPMDHARRSSSDSDHRNALPPGARGTGGIGRRGGAWHAHQPPPTHPAGLWDREG